MAGVTAKKATKKAIAKTPVAKAAVGQTSVAGKPVAKTSAAAKAAEKTGAASLDPAKRIDAKIAALGDWRGTRMAELRRLVHDVDPQVIEEWKWKGTPVWSHAGMYAVANAHKDKVKLTFFHGAKLDDPNRLFNAGLDGGKWRAIDFREGDAIDTPALKALLREAIAYNATHAVPKSRGSRA